jgi:hypothetical protein
MNTCLSVGVFKSDKLQASFENRYMSQGYVAHQTLKIFKKWRKTGATSVLTAEGLLGCVYSIGSIIIVVITVEDSFVLNRLIFSRVERILKQSDMRLTMEVHMHLEEIVSKEIPAKQPFINLNGTSGQADDRLIDGAESDIFFESLKNKKKDTETIDFIFNRLRFDFLKEEAFEDLRNLQPITTRAMEEGAYEQFLVNLNTWDKQKKVDGDEKKLSLNLKGSLQSSSELFSVTSNSAIKPKQTKEALSKKALLVLEEKLTIKITETVINEKYINGKLLISNFEANKLYSVIPKTSQWSDNALIDKRKFAGIDSHQHMENEGEFRIIIPKEVESTVIPLYEYVISPSLITNETIPFYIAYMKNPGKLFLKVSNNKKFQKHFLSFRLEIEVLNIRNENTVECSHEGNLKGNVFIIELKVEDIRNEHVLLKMNMNDNQAVFSSVLAKCQIARGLLDLDFSLKSGVFENISGLNTKLNVEYMLII